jgi:hypothetical protein
MFDNPVVLGDLGYDSLAGETNHAFDQLFPDWFGYSSPPVDIYDGMSNLSLFSPPNSYATSPDITYVLASIRSQNPLTSHLRTVPFPSSHSPSPSLSQTSSTPDHHQISPEPSPTPEPSCRKAAPVSNRIRGKWRCSACDRVFRGRWECKRHITDAGKRAVCLACGTNISGRKDSLRRHFTKYCNGNLRFEDAFIEA